MDVPQFPSAKTEKILRPMIWKRYSNCDLNLLCLGLGVAYWIALKIKIPIRISKINLGTNLEEGGDVPEQKAMIRRDTQFLMPLYTLNLLYSDLKVTWFENFFCKTHTQLHYPPLFFMHLLWTAPVSGIKIDWLIIHQSSQLAALNLQMSFSVWAPRNDKILVTRSSPISLEKDSTLPSPKWTQELKPASVLPKTSGPKKLTNNKCFTLRRSDFLPVLKVWEDLLPWLASRVRPAAVTIVQVRNEPLGMS